jgi:predicted transcriptional regulator of viral defense system
MPKPAMPILAAIKELGRPVFTTHDAAACCRGSSSNTVQALNHLMKQGMVVKIARGIWGLGAPFAKISPYDVIACLSPNQRVYVSFLSALHLHGIIEQIPQSITLASTGHTRTIPTKLGTFFIHRVAPSFFKGFDWYKGQGSFLIAEPEKALVDCLYLSARKKKQFAHFPELRFPASFKMKRAEDWVKQIPDPKIQTAVLKKLKLLQKSVRK